VRRFRFVYLANSDVRLMEKAADPPGRFCFEHSPTELVVVRDVIDYLDGVPRHRMLDVQVTCDGDSLNETTLAHAHALAESTLILLSAVARAPTGDVQFVVAYEITPGAEACALLQYLAADEVPAPRTPAPSEFLQGIWTATYTAVASDPPLATRVIISMSWYRRALRELDDLFRFSNLWLACEALNPRLCDEYSIPNNERGGLPGMRRLLQEVLGEDITFKAAVAARNDLLHANRVLPEDIRRRVRPIISKLDDALIEGWRILLALPKDAEVPQSSVRPYPSGYVLQAMVRPDAEGWSEDRHPQFGQIIQLKAQEPERPGDVKYEQSPTWKLRNALEFSHFSYGHLGPETPNPYRVELAGDVRVSRNEERDGPPSAETNA
jgi:hypothetical protein